MDGDVWVSELRGRNVNFRVDSSRGTGWFIKQVATGEPTGPLAVESWFYRRTANRDAADIRAYVPPFVRLDRGGRLLVLGLLPDAAAVHELLDDSAPATAMPPLGAALGHALGTLHRVFPFRRSRARPDDAAGVAHPWILDVHAPPVELLRHLSPAQLAIIETLQRHGAADAAFSRLRSNWAPATLIHGDVKWSNVLLTEVADGGGVPARSSDSPSALQLIDWEFASWGDPAWDVGSAFHSFLVDCIAHAALTAPTAGEAAAAFARALPRAWPEIRAFHDAYVSARALRGKAIGACVAAAIHYCAVRLVQTAWESCERAAEMPNFAAGELQLALNILERPGEAGTTLLGLDRARMGS